MNRIVYLPLSPDMAVDTASNMQKQFCSAQMLREDGQDDETQAQWGEREDT